MAAMNWDQEKICERNLYAAYVDGELDTDLTLLFEDHLEGCAECRAEFDALNMTLRLTTRLSETAAPAESYWSGYHARLREKLATTPNPSHPEKQ